jgi:hypothetical protein
MKIALTGYPLLYRAFGALNSTKGEVLSRIDHEGYNTQMWDYYIIPAYFV